VLLLLLLLTMVLSRRLIVIVRDAIVGGHDHRRRGLVVAVHMVERLVHMREEVRSVIVRGHAATGAAVIGHVLVASVASRVIIAIRVHGGDGAR